MYSNTLCYKHGLSYRVYVYLAIYGRFSMCHTSLGGLMRMVARYTLTFAMCWVEWMAFDGDKSIYNWCHTQKLLQTYLEWTYRFVLGHRLLQQRECQQVPSAFFFWWNWFLSHDACACTTIGRGHHCWSTHKVYFRISTGTCHSWKKEVDETSTGTLYPVGEKMVEATQITNHVPCLVIWYLLLDKITKKHSRSNLWEQKGGSWAIGRQW